MTAAGPVGKARSVVGARPPSPPLPHTVSPTAHLPPSPRRLQALARASGTWPASRDPRRGRFGPGCGRRFSEAVPPPGWV